jgi:hypothetical protein
LFLKFIQMHILALSLLAILAGTLLLAKTKKEELGKFFSYISWFFLVVGFLLFAGSIAGGICKMKHGCILGHPGCQKEMMMKDCRQGMGKHGGAGCPAGMCKGAIGNKACCMKNDSTMKACPKHMQGDSAKICCPEKKHAMIPK